MTLEAGSAVSHFAWMWRATHLLGLAGALVACGVAPAASGDLPKAADAPALDLLEWRARTAPEASASVKWAHAETANALSTLTSVSRSRELQELGGGEAAAVDSILTALTENTDGGAAYRASFMARWIPRRDCELRDAADDIRLSAALRARLPPRAASTASALQRARHAELVCGEEVWLVAVHDGRVVRIADRTPLDDEVPDGLQQLLDP